MPSLTAQDIIDRLKAMVGTLGGRVYPASDYLRLTQTGGEPQNTPAVFVIPTGGQAGQSQGMVGGYRQPLDRLWSLILVIRSDAAGGRAIDQADQIIDALVDAMTGWDGGGLVGQFVLRRWQVIRSPPGSLAWEITLSIQDLIRKAMP